MNISKDSLVFLLGGVVVGMIGGILIARLSVPKQVPVAVVQQQPVQPATGAQGELPDGHPPIDEASLKSRIVEYEKQIQNDPENQDAILALANLNFQIKNYPESAKWFEKALSKDTQNLNTMADLGNVYLWGGETQKSIDVLTRALSIDPKHLQSLMNLGVARMSLGDKAGAAEAWGKVLEFYPNHEQAPMLRDAIQRLRAQQ